jgi:hypothetical protein
MNEREGLLFDRRVTGETRQAAGLGANGCNEQPRPVTVRKGKRETEKTIAMERKCKEELRNRSNNNR